MKQCYDAYKNINIVNYNGQVGISTCCLMPTRNVNVIDFEKNSLLESVRMQWKLNSDFPIECNSCKHSEDQGMDSRRLGVNQWYADNHYDNDTVELIKLDFYTGNLCNLRCAICGPDSSSAWASELNMDLTIKNKVIINQEWQNLPLEKVKFIHFNGGEPLLSKEHINFLEAIPNKSQVFINYNTNGTVIPSKNLIKLWEKFKLVQLDFSIDDIELRFEYQRYPANWQQLITNLKWFVDHSPVNCMFAVNTTVSILNYNNLNNLNNWLKCNFFENRLGDTVEHRTQLATGLFALENFNKRADKIVSFLDACDHRRGTNWRITLPELQKIL